MKYERLTKRYERLTKRADNYPKVKSCPKDYETISCIDCGCCDELDEALFRLAELEDKIEAGTLVELPCKVGDEVYIIAKRGLDIYDVEKIIVADIWYSETDNRLYPITADECPLSEIFLTKAEAEAKLKELRGEV